MEYFFGDLVKQIALSEKKPPLRETFLVFWSLPMLQNLKLLLEFTRKGSMVKEEELKALLNRMMHRTGNGPYQIL